MSDFYEAEDARANPSSRKALSRNKLISESILYPTSGSISYHIFAGAAERNTIIGPVPNVNISSGSVYFAYDPSGKLVHSPREVNNPSTRGVFISESDFLPLQTILKRAILIDDQQANNIILDEVDSYETLRKPEKLQIEAGGLGIVMTALFGGLLLVSVFYKVSLINPLIGFIICIFGVSFILMSRVGLRGADGGISN